MTVTESMFQIDLAVGDVLNDTGGKLLSHWLYSLNSCRCGWEKRARIVRAGCRRSRAQNTASSVRFAVATGGYEPLGSSRRSLKFVSLSTIKLADCLWSDV
jgi:hypothetical protein